MSDNEYPLFGDWLMRTQILQRMSYGSNPAKLEGDERAEYFRTMMAALVFELGEVSNEIGWKTWGTDRTIDRERYISEMVDVLHFAGNLLILAGCTDAELNTAYNKKMKVNVERMLREDYNGRTDGKCLICRRSFDDVGQHVEARGDLSPMCVPCADATFGAIA